MAHGLGFAASRVSCFGSATRHGRRLRLGAAARTAILASQQPSNLLSSELARAPLLFREVESFAAASLIDVELSVDVLLWGCRSGTLQAPQ